jgi:hypothetical protein
MQVSWNGAVSEWFVRLIGIRNDGATFGAYIVLEDEYKEGVTFDNIKNKHQLGLRQCLDSQLYESFDGKKVPLNAYKGNQEWEEQ